MSSIQLRERVLKQEAELKLLHVCQLIYVFKILLVNLHLLPTTITFYLLLTDYYYSYFYYLYYYYCYSCYCLL